MVRNFYCLQATQPVALYHTSLSSPRPFSTQWCMYLILKRNGCGPSGAATTIGHLLPQFTSQCLLYCSPSLPWLSRSLFSIRRDTIMDEWTHSQNPNPCGEDELHPNSGCFDNIPVNRMEAWESSYGKDAAFSPVPISEDHRRERSPLILRSSRIFLAQSPRFSGFEILQQYKDCPRIVQTQPRKQVLCVTQVLPSLRRYRAGRLLFQKLSVKYGNLHDAQVTSLLKACKRHLLSKEIIVIAWIKLPQSDSVSL